MVLGGFHGWCFAGVFKFLVRSVLMMRFAANSLGAEGGAAVARSLTALTALQTLNLQCTDIMGVEFFDELCLFQEGNILVALFAMLMRDTGTYLGAEGGAAVARSLTALALLQTLDLSCNSACFIVMLL